MIGDGFWPDLVGAYGESHTTLLWCLSFLCLPAADLAFFRPNSPQAKSNIPVIDMSPFLEANRYACAPGASVHFGTDIGCADTFEHTAWNRCCAQLWQMLANSCSFASIVTRTFVFFAGTHRTRMLPSKLWRGSCATRARMLGSSTLRDTGMSRATGFGTGW